MHIMWIDTETGGLNAYKNGLLQIAGMLEEEGKISLHFNWKFQPLPGEILDQKALEVTGFTKDEIATWPENKTVYKDFLDICDSYVDKFNRQDKMVLAGYNVNFDRGMLNQWFRKNGNNYFFSYFYGMPLDVGSFVLDYCLTNNVKLKNHKLETVADHFGIEANFHDAADDIRVTREIYLKIKEQMKCV